MTRVLVTGSTDGIGQETASQLLADGHDVVLHARTGARADDARRSLPTATEVVVGDLSSLASTRDLAADAASVGPYDVVINNAGVGRAPERTVTDDGLERIFQVNVVAPYLLTALMPRPSRLVYLSSNRQAFGGFHPDDLNFDDRPWDGHEAYADSKLYDVMLAFAVARLWPDVISNAVDPGWIRTRMGGPQATDELPEGAETQVWLATSDDPEATGSGRYLRRREVLEPNPVSRDLDAQDRLLDELDRLTGVGLPDRP